MILMYIFFFFQNINTTNYFRYPKSCLPVTEAGLKQFLASLWREKETTLTNFYEKGYFEIPDSEKIATPSPQDSPEYNTQVIIYYNESHQRAAELLIF